MNLRIHIPDHLNSALIARAAESGKDVESFVVDSICEQLEAPDSGPSVTADFDLWLAEVQSLVPGTLVDVDDSRDSIYAGRGE